VGTPSGGRECPCGLARPTPAIKKQKGSRGFERRGEKWEDQAKGSPPHHPCQPDVIREQTRITEKPADRRKGGKKGNPEKKMKGGGGNSPGPKRKRHNDGKAIGKPPFLGRWKRKTLVPERRSLVKRNFQKKAECKS